LNVYADSSFLVSSYVQDRHSAEAARRLALLPSVWVTPLNRSEIAHAIHRYVFRGVISPAEATRDWNNFQRDCLRATFISVDFPERTWETSIDLARKYGSTFGVRTLDSLHVACALELNAQKFWTFDDRQARLAEAVGLETKA
jgi:predicted nucleic acid-binding protein